MTKKKKILITLLVLCLFFGGIYLFISLYLPQAKEYYDEENTVEHQANILRIEIDTKQYTIYTYQYHCGLIIQADEIINNDYLFELYDRENITFRIPALYDDWLQDEKKTAVMIVSLKAGGVEIVTLESHKKWDEKTDKRLQIIGLVFSSLFLSGAILCSALLIKDKVKRADN